MAKTNLFRSYGRKNENSSGLQESGLDFTSVEVTEVDKEPQTIASKENDIPLEKSPKKQIAKKITTEVEKQKQGRPSLNPGLKVLVRTYKIAEDVEDAMKEKFFENRKEWSKNMSFSKYITNLIWADTHNGEQFYDPKTGKCVVDFEQDEG